MEMETMNKCDTKFIYFECRDCGFDSIQRYDFDGDDLCPLCLSDSGHIVHMKQRAATADDRPEGFDARKANNDLTAGGDRIEQTHPNGRTRHLEASADHRRRND